MNAPLGTPPTAPWPSYPQHSISPEVLIAHAASEPVRAMSVKEPLGIFD